jgi:cbb3-type cytochrome oxidase subunit 3
MKLSDVVSHSGLAGYAEVALVLFLIAFAVVAVRTFWPGRRAHFDHVSSLPLEDGDESRPAEEVRR